MSPAHLIEHARQSGVVLMLIGERLTWSASQQPPPDLLALLRDNKPAVIEHLRQQQRAWLERVAALLDTTANDLLARRLIDANDMAEQYRTDPRHAAKLIASCPDWLALARVRGQFREQYARARAREPVLGSHPYKPADPTRRPAWAAARDALHRHSVSSCPACHPPTGRYCPTGRVLLAHYLEQQP
ncbi:hypothetical protein LO767_04100 [Halopseudomonas aestusnigri]|uniref:TubC N-terminal docking domain-related protein n=1 Tax=Halopseudomonas aestusnigri TaxID=857252 RepID=UPI001E4B2D19|nr:hypothetical protein [Halopseudomonas aestusnigri]UGV31689.1 hypothetical protein LO767_04100 [Halopseudomonas aestusnigri]